MNWLNNYIGEIERLFAEAANRIESLPYPLNEQASTLLNRCRPRNERADSNYISYLLPYWLKESILVNEEVCNDLAAGNLFATLHFCLLDDAMDKSPDQADAQARNALALGQFFYHFFIQYYLRHFPIDSPVWIHFERYLAEWALAVSREGHVCADPRDAHSLAVKAGPLKICIAGCLLLTGRSEWLAHLEEAVDLALATLQLADDWADWQEDLAEKNDSSFLAMVRECLAREPGIPLEERSVKQAVYRHSCLERLADIAETNGRRLMEIPDVPEPLIAFHKDLAGGLREDARTAKETTEKLELGGFSYFLSNFKN